MSFFSSILGISGILSKKLTGQGKTLMRLVVVMVLVLLRSSCRSLSLLMLRLRRTKVRVSDQGVDIYPLVFPEVKCLKNMLFSLSPTSQQN
jgi:hypothetical protein